jgi:transcriptional regulator with XRE-family HTH domain
MSKSIAKIGSKHTRYHLYIAEWREHLGLTADQVAGRIGTSRQTIYRWEKDQKRLTPEKIGALATAMDIRPERFWRPPDSTPSLDALLAPESAEVKATAVDIVQRLIRR